MKSISTLSALERFEHAWNQISGNPAHCLLKVVLIREMIHTIHAEYSSLLVSGDPQDAKTLAEIEKRLELLRQESLGEKSALPGDFAQLIHTLSQESNLAAIDQDSSELPQKLVLTLGKEKLFRIDHTWELTIAVQAIRAGWSFWSVECQIQLYHLKDWHRNLDNLLWPRGITLWTENANKSENPFSSIDPKTPKDEIYWNSEWTLILHPELDPKSLSSRILDFDQTHKTISPEWFRLYPESTSSPTQSDPK